jgi:small GTP-binding protein
MSTAAGARLPAIRRPRESQSNDRRDDQMPMPHQTFAALAKRRLVGKEGRDRIREVRALIAELPDYRNGPYADLRKSLLAEIEETRVRSSAVHRDSIAVRREGAAQIALVGPPNVGKSSILQALSDIQIKTGDYAFTTLRPVPALARFGGVLVQLVEIPGLIEGAAEDRGGGRALLGVLRAADAIVYCTRAASNGKDLDVVRTEVAAAGIEKPAIVAVTRADEADPGLVDQIVRAVDLPVVPVSILDEHSLDALRDAIWRLTGLIRVRLRTNGVTATEPLALHPPATVEAVADWVHHDLAASFTGARVWGPSAKFDGQRVGRDHVVADGDTVEIVTSTTRAS